MAQCNVSAENEQLSVEDAKSALNEILAAFQQPQNVKKIDEGREKAGNDMLKVMQFVFPITAQIQSECIKNYGFSSDGQGTIKFTQMVKSLEHLDSEIARLNFQLKMHFIPQVNLPTLQKN
ncbi:Uncharacterised protein g10243 [Pycnogonum litorale]